MKAKKKGIVAFNNKDYKTVALRVTEFRSDHSIDDGWAIQASIVSIDEERIVMQAWVVSPTGITVGRGHAEEVRGSSRVNDTSALENCETSAIGRALASCGWGGEEYCSADELVNALVQQAEVKKKPAAPKVQAPVVAFAAQPDPVAPKPGEAPPCPDCGGPMWDNADKRRQGGKSPAYKCKESKWDSATKSASGCQGIVWDAVDEGVALRDIIEPDRHEDYEVGLGQPEEMPF